MNRRRSLARRANQVPIVRAMEERKQLIKAVLQGTDYTTFKALLLTVLRENPALRDANPQSFLTALYRAAKSGLMRPDTAHLIYFVPFNDSQRGTTEVEFIEDYRGLILKILEADPEVANIVPYAVHENDQFEVQLGSEPKIHHVPALKNRGEIVGAYCMVYYKDPARDPFFRWVDIDTIESHKRRSASAQAGKGPWVEDYEAMVLKTAVRVTANFMKQTCSLYNAIQADEPKAPVEMPEFDVEEVDAEEAEETEAPPPEPQEPPSPQRVAHVKKSRPAQVDAYTAILEQAKDRGLVDTTGQPIAEWHDFLVSLNLITKKQGVRDIPEQWAREIADNFDTHFKAFNRWLDKQLDKQQEA